ncbi:hypothetical protein L7F22_064730 [Adiantum nelumboides]|nr:hypothetical protein [Adiantum nelumboides]
MGRPADAAPVLAASQRAGSLKGELSRSLSMSSVRGRRCCVPTSSWACGEDKVSPGMGFRLPSGALGASMASNIDIVCGKGEGGCPALFWIKTPKDLLWWAWYRNRFVVASGGYSCAARIMKSAGKDIHDPLLLDSVMDSDAHVEESCLNRELKGWDTRAPEHKGRPEQP